MSTRVRSRRKADKIAYALDRMNLAIERLLGGDAARIVATARWVVRWGLVLGMRPPTVIRLRSRVGPSP
jgi:hypothetical protein